MLWCQHLGCWGQSSSQIQNKEIYVTLYFQAADVMLWPVNVKFKHRAPCFLNGVKSSIFYLDLRCVWISNPSTLGAGVKTRLESRIQMFTPHCICSPPGHRALSYHIVFAGRCRKSIAIYCGSSPRYGTHWRPALPVVAKVWYTLATCSPCRRQGMVHTGDLLSLSS